MAKSFAATLAVVRDATTAQTRAYVALLSFRGKDTFCGLAVACWQPENAMGSVRFKSCAMMHVQR